MRRVRRLRRVQRLWVLAWNGRVLERFVILTPRYPAALADVFSDSPSALAAASAPVANAVISSSEGAWGRSLSDQRNGLCAKMRTG